MINFQILKKSKKSRARLGLLQTPHGVIETPAFVPVATQAVIKTLTSEEVAATGSQILISNTFHLHLKPGESVVKRAGGIHNFMNWRRPLMTDSGGFQVFSLGFGRDFNTGKIARESDFIFEELVKNGSQPRDLRITDRGVYFRSPLDGQKLFIGPKESMKIQEKIGADIIFAFDECTSPHADYDYVKKAMERTHKWAKICLAVKKSDQAMFGIVQGSRFQDLRKESARFINSLGFAGFGIGGDLGYSITDMYKVMGWTLPFLDEKLPRHLLGIGYLRDMEDVVKSGIDLFDCIVPTHYGRRGIAFIAHASGFEKINLNRSAFLKDRNPLDRKCTCPVCSDYRRSYIAHLFRAKEITAMKMLTLHNLYFFSRFVEDIRNGIKAGKI